MLSSFVLASTFMFLLLLQQEQQGGDDQYLETQNQTAAGMAAAACPAAASSADGTRHVTRLVVFVPTPIQWSSRRERVAATFISQGWKPCHVHLAFIVGTKAGKHLEHSLNASSMMHAEMDQYASHTNIHYVMSPCRDLGDEFDNPNGTSSTTCKTYHGFKFAAQTFQADFVWRGADDAYLNLLFFFKEVEPLLPRNKPIYMGNIRDATAWTWDLSLYRQASLQKQVWRMPAFGSYMFGMGFLVSMDVAQFVDSWKISPHLSWCEDVMVGAWFMPFQITWIDANEHGWYMYDRKHFYADIRRCQRQLLVHYVREDDWSRISPSTGNMQFCMQTSILASLF